MQYIESLIKEINCIDSKEQLVLFFEKVTDLFNYKWSGLVIFKPKLNNKYEVSVLGNIPINMQERIKKSIDISDYCLNEIEPKSLVIKGKASIESNNLEILVIPINGVGSEFACLTFLLNSEKQRGLVVEKIGWFWLMLSSFIYNKYKKEIADDSHKMTKRELECIKWASDGKTSWEISQLLSISQRTVDFHLANCIVKTDSINRQQAIVKCALNGHLLV
ncbi:MULTISPECIES: helix-turn-helix transcriptional regulator [unclassified Pseudoalteromonas]|uniref:Transcriptional receptor protein PalR4 n=1 Tax=Pseudoalteromonas sp. 520P1 TaxID=1529052 RepID=A0A0M4TUP3_9GAMM|nr:MULTISPECIES: helix-turn-helix transcriptional regulator [unclassified Pseudoalteromonas]BAS32728.1 Transcriptional receptor protein PalR4 [Pseudoalteromonas sp. 520P1]